MANDSLCFLEQTDFSLLVARGAAGSSPVRLEALQEIPLSDTAAATAAVRAAFTAENATVLCALRPKPQRLHFAGEAEAKSNPGLGGLRQVATQLAELSSLPPAWVAAVQARDGAVPAASPWLASLTSTEGYAAAQALLTSLQVKPSRSLSASLNTVGAIASAVTAPIWLLEIGELGSHAFLVSREGVHAAGPVSVNLDRIAEAVQAELGLKFKGSAVKLFFNPVYDYNEVGPKIAARLATALKTELATLRGKNPAPIAFACTGLPAAQQWFATQLAAALDLAAFSPETSAAGVAFDTPELESSVSPAWFGFLRLIGSSRSGAAAPWEAEWIKLDTIALPVAPKPAPAPAPVVAPAPKPATAAPVAPPAAAAAKPAAPKPAAPVPFPLPDAPAAKPAPAPVRQPAPVAPAAAAPAAKSAPAALAPAAKPAAPAPAAPTAAAKPAPAKVAPGPTPAPAAAKASPAPAPTKPAVSSAVSYSAKPNAPEKAAAPKKASPPPPVTLPVNTLPMADVPPSRPIFKNKVILMIVAFVVVLGLGGLFFVKSQNAAAERDAERVKAEQRLQAEIAKNHDAEARAKAEEATRKKVEADAAAKVAEAEAARQRAENEARTSVAARLANARGILTISSDPAGATVTVGTLAPRPTPATFTDLKIGKYPVSIAMNLYDTAQLELEVKEDATTDSGVVKLNKILGSLELNTEPAGVAYEVKPANAMIVMPDARRTGKTPVTLTDFIPGDYNVTFVRDGWMPQIENVTIVRDSTAHVKGMFPNGIVKLNSKPSGAIVTRDGVRVGVTPLTLSDQLPGDATYLITLIGFAPEPVSGRIVGGQVLEFNPQLEVYDHISKLSELDQQPKVISTVQPKVPYEFVVARKSAKVNVELTITRDGSTRDLVVLPGSDHALSAACLAAAAQWKFRPGSIHGRAANVRMIVPFSFEPTE